MGFTKGNTLGKQANIAKEDYRARYKDYLVETITCLAPEYQRLLGKQLRGEALPSSTSEAMDRLERHFEYVWPKLARVENTHQYSDQGMIQIQSVLEGLAALTTKTASQDSITAPKRDIVDVEVVSDTKTSINANKEPTMANEGKARNKHTRVPKWARS